ncbi:MAG: phage head closure protein [Gammaproteobacteria bacterium]
MSNLALFAMSGEMKRWITVQQTASSQNARGEEIPTWTTFACVWAKIVPLSGREFLAAQQVEATLTHTITIRYLAGLDPTMRIVYNGRYFDINQVININEEDRQMSLLCTERVAEQ